MFRTLLWSSEVRCEVQKFISEFTSQFVNKGCDWLLNSMKPIKCLVYKPTCEFWNELLNFATNFRTSQRSSESYNEKLPEIDCNNLVWQWLCTKFEISPEFQWTTSVLLQLGQWVTVAWLDWIFRVSSVHGQLFLPRISIKVQTRTWMTATPMANPPTMAMWSLR